MKDKVKLFITVGRRERGEAQWRIEVQELRASLILVNKSDRNPHGEVRV
jgi:hypothetical protein